MPYKETEDVKLYWSVSEVARILKVNESLIRFWDKEFDIIKPVRNKKGNRMFTKGDIENFKHIFHLVKVKGHTLEGARKMLKFRKEEMDSTTVLRDSLQRVRNFLTELKDTV